ncbi:MAG TPA: hypothetical protein VK550_17145, partial [Polyangiaceae bacterium]|nr:hypothetical protein [Polyangiaceae bacterium]
MTTAKGWQARRVAAITENALSRNAGAARATARTKPPRRDRFPTRQQAAGDLARPPNDTHNYRPSAYPVPRCHRSPHLC